MTIITGTEYKANQGLVKAKNKKEPVYGLFHLQVAEREGFEPPVPLSTAVFKTAVIDHSTISP